MTPKFQTMWQQLSRLRGATAAAPPGPPRDPQIESFVAEIVVKCPATNKPVSTGLRPEWVIFKSLPPVALPLRCPECGKVHQWKPDDAWIEQRSTAPESLPS